MPEIVLFPGALTISNAGFNLSKIVTFVAFEGPLLVTVIVNLTKSPTLALPVIFEYLITVKLTFGLTVILVMFDEFSPPSVEFTTATFPMVPFIVVFTCTQSSTDWPLVKLPIIHVTRSTLPMSDFTPLSVMLLPDFTYTSPAGRLSHTDTFVALLGPLFVTIIV